MEKSEVSIHEVKVFLHFQAAPNEWITNAAASKKTGLPMRTTSSHTKKLVELGILDQAEVFPAHHFRLSSQAGKRNKAYLQRLQKAIEVFGLSVPS